MVGMGLNLTNSVLSLSKRLLLKRGGGGRGTANRIILVQISLTTLKDKTLEISIHTNTA